MLGFTKFKINRLVNRRELYSNFSYNKWNQLDTGSKWKCLQQLENHFAAEQGRPAVKVLPISSKEARGAYGGYDPDKNVIYINRDLVEYGTLVGPVDINHPTQLDANMQLFDTIAHEGYHAYQGYAIKHPGFHKDMKQVKEWAINDRNVKYFRRGDEYLVQPRERDAWKYGSEKTREAFDEIEKYYGTEPGRAMYEKSVEDNSYENALERLWNNNPDALNQMYKEMMDAYEERYRENNSTVNLDPITVDEYDAISREAVNRYYEHLKNNPSLSNEDVMRMTGDMSEKYFSAVEEYKNAVQQKEKSEDRGEKENRTEKYEAQNPENRSIFNPDRVSVEEYDKTLRDQVNKYYEHLKNDPSLSNEDVMRMTEEMSEKYLTAVEEYRNAQKQEDEGFQEKSGDNEKALAAVKRLKEIYELLKIYGVEKYISFDFGMLNKYQYYTGVIFRGYTYGTGDAVVKGGRYDHLLARFGKPSPSIGFAVVVDQLLSALGRQKIAVPVEQGPTLLIYEKKDRTSAMMEANNLRKQGCSVVLMEKKDTMEAYEAYGKRNGFYAVRKFDASDSLAM